MAALEGSQVPCEVSISIHFINVQWNGYIWRALNLIGLVFDFSDETWNIKTRSQKQKKRIRSERTAKNGTSRTTKGVVKLEPRLFKCHHTSCDFSERYNFKVIEHLLSVHQEKEPKTCKCGFKFYPEIYKVETHRCIKKSKKRVSTGVFPCEVRGLNFCHLICRSLGYFFPVPNTLA